LARAATAPPAWPTTLASLRQKCQHLC